MPARTFDDFRRKEFKWVIVPMWMEDLLYVVRRLNPAVTNPTQLQKWIKKELVTKGWGKPNASASEESQDSDTPPEFSYLYNKYFRGKVFPGARTVEGWLFLFSEIVERVPNLVLWDAISANPLTKENAAEIWNKLSPDVTRILDRKRLPTHAALERLVSLCHVDVLTALLILIRTDLQEARPNDPGQFELADLLIPYARETIVRLSVFPPFQRRGLLLGRVLEMAFFSIPYGGSDGKDDFYWKMRADDVGEMIMLMKRAGSLGLLSPSLDVQIRLVNGWRSRDIEHIPKASFYQYCYREKAVVEPTDPFWRSLKYLHHPATRTKQPIHIPWRGRWSSGDFRIANVLREPDFEQNPSSWSSSAKRSAKPVSVVNQGKRGGQSGGAHAHAKTGKNDRRNR